MHLQGKTARRGGPGPQAIGQPTPPEQRTPPQEDRTPVGTQEAETQDQGTSEIHTD